MIPTGSRLLFGATALASVTAIIYASTVWGALGTTGLVFLAVALGVVAGINLFVRDSDVAADDPAGATESAAARRAPMPSIWPVIGALGGVLVVLGLITYPVVFVFGIVTLLAAVVEWMLEAWSERASASQQFNTDVRERLAHPAEFPVLAALLVGVVVYSFSRIMLFLSKTGGPIAFGVVAALVLAVGFLIAYRPQLKSSAVQAVAAIAILGLVAGGVVTAIAGERELHPHETTGTLAALGQCDTPDETHADEHASQTIGAKANLHGEVILRSDGTLVARSTGVAGESDVLTIARANATNVRFRNESGERRRLVLDLGEAPVDEAAAGAMVEPTIAEETPTTDAAEDHGDDAAGGDGDAEHGAAAGEPGRIQICTPLVDDGGTSLLTFEIGPASSEENVYLFFVPGVDGQSVEMMVP